MSRIFFLLSFIFLGVIRISAQSNYNLQLLSTFDYSERCNDVWGYVDASGNEYAIMGTQNATTVISLADPANPVELAYIPGTVTSWRDMKSYGNYIYAVADGQSTTDGLLVIDMTHAPQTITHRYENLEVILDNDTFSLEACHNIYIDEQGYAYLAGCRINGGASIIFDCFTDPGHPRFVGAIDGAYAHDVYARGDTLWSSNVYAGNFTATDVSDKSNPLLIGIQSTSSEFTHNAWLSDDGRHLFTTDELPNAYVDAYDVSDLSDIKRLDQYQPAKVAGTGAIPHNVHYKDGYLVISHYSEGVKVVDAHRPDNLIEVGCYDTFTPNQSGFNGCWGAYPFLPSGLILASDQTNGLFVFQPTYKRASYLEGIVRQSDTNTPLNGVRVEIQSEAVNFAFSNSSGIYKTGQLEAGSFDVTFSLPGYASQTLAVNLSSGELTTLDVALVKLPRYSLSGRVLDAATGKRLPDTKIDLMGMDFSYQLLSDEQGQFDLSDIVKGEYAIYAGQWGYKNVAIEKNFDQSLELTIQLEKGYRDDFIVDQGWMVSGDASTGHWELGQPIGTYYEDAISNPEEDLSGDLGESCYVTGNAEGAVGLHDVDEGAVILSSPHMFLSDFLTPTVSFHTWFFNASGGAAPDDTLKIYLQNTTDTVLIEQITESGSTWSEKKEFLVSDYLSELDSVQVVFITADIPGKGNLLEAGVDAFEALDASVSSTTHLLDPGLVLQLAPNPFTDRVSISYENTSGGEAHLLLYNGLGQQIRGVALPAAKGKLELGAHLPKGIYFVHIMREGRVSRTLKMVKS